MLSFVSSIQNNYPNLEFCNKYQMPSSFEVDLIKDENMTISFIIAENCEDKLVKINGREYHSFGQLPSDIFSEKQMMLLAKIANFFGSGMDYTVIENPVAFKEHYENEYNRNQSCPLFPGISIFGKFDTSEIECPKYNENKDLVFYVEKQGVPYRVTVEGLKCNGELATKYENLRHSTK